jgi:hypothetical protein
MDSAYDAPEIKANSLALGHVPIIDPHPRSVPGGKQAIAAEALARRTAGYQAAEDVRYDARGGAERINGGLKDDFGGLCAGARPRQGALPPDVRHPRPDHQSTDEMGSRNS